MRGRCSMACTCTSFSWESGAECLYRELERQVPGRCLNEHWFVTLREPQLMIEAWRREYNEERTHSWNGDMTPQEFIIHYQTRAS
jgi:transposase InsO family protein